MITLSEPPISPPDEAEIPDDYYDKAKADLLDDYRRKLASGEMEDEIRERAEFLLKEDRS